MNRHGENSIHYQVCREIEDEITAMAEGWQFSTAQLARLMEVVLPGVPISTLRGALHDALNSASDRGLVRRIWRGVSVKGGEVDDGD
ncbi:MAG: hypothetical protein V2A74_10790 [bacterium]